MPSQSHVWHPYTRFSFLRDDPLPFVVRAEGSWLYLKDGSRLFDGISSWWCMNLGHGRPELMEAMAQQARQLDHSILGNLVHEPALELAKQLAHRMPSPDRHIMFGSDGSAAVEASLKIAVQYFHNIGETQRTEFVSLSEPYHGDTLGAVSVGFMDGYHRPFKALVFQSHPAVPPGSNEPGESMENVLRKQGHKVAAVIVEPLLQGASGMRMYPPKALCRIAELCKDAGALLICDEIATGFYRTGTEFAFQQAEIDPDIILLGKGLTGGTFPLSAAVVRDSIYETFSDLNGEDHTFWHGHTYTGHPTGCAVALAALGLYEKLNAPALVKHGADILASEWNPLLLHPDIREVRILGMVAAIEFRNDDPARMQSIRRQCMQAGLYLRPLGRVVYLFPPLTTSEGDLRWACQIVKQAILSSNT